MKRKFVMLSIVLLINAGMYAQKDQIKAAQSVFESGKSQDALGVLKKIEYLIFNSTDEEKSDFYFLKGNIFKDLASKNIDMANNLSLASEAYQELIKFENEAGKYKYSLQANVALREMKSKLVNGAADDFKVGKYKESAEKSYKVYLFDKKDTLNLFYAASSSMSAKDYDSAIKYYEELRKINYSGKGVVYYAINKKTKVEESFASANVRTASVTGGFHEKPRDVFSPSKKFEINKNLAYIYLEKNDAVKAEICYNKALELDPNYIDAYINLAYIKLESKKALMDQMDALGNTPKEMELYDQLKVKKENLVKSVIPYLKKALVIDPKNQDVMKSLLGVYRSLDMTNEYNSLKASM
ncbi:tetratricopeptide repeat protein [Flavobacterium granuli]|uniref:Tetratricopeptide (TPR) repeat protein n=1 Tax=Flavobacterium granuli TaxID=280093 RepID=A0ABU1S0U8_9FLAO|nr:tetratricopeptide repeat protein [Flavobacterium granuli]MDR6844542.1 tetratricopeptide (TPR) repeat protein [Flavobacterium granuli]